MLTRAADEAYDGDGLFTVLNKAVDSLDGEDGDGSSSGPSSSTKRKRTGMSGVLLTNRNKNYGIPISRWPLQGKLM